MQLAPTPINEIQRLTSLKNLNILDTPSEERFDRIVRIAQNSLNAPVAFIAFVDEKRVWFKSKYNYNHDCGPRDISICGHAICNTVTDDISSRIFEVENTTTDKRFFDNPYVSPENGLRYYMAFILQSKDGQNIGTLCIVDHRPRTLSSSDKKMFTDLGLIAQAELDNNPSALKLQKNNFLSHASNDTNIINDPTEKLTSLSAKLLTLQKQFDSSLKSRDITYREWCVLNEIIQGESASPNIISRKLAVSRPVMTRRLESLEIKRFIERCNSANGDRRYVKLASTKRGEEVWKKGHDQVNHLTKLLLEDFL